QKGARDFVDEERGGLEDAVEVAALEVGEERRGGEGRTGVDRVLPSRRREKLAEVDAGRLRDGRLQRRHEALDSARVRRQVTRVRRIGNPTCRLREDHVRRNYVSNLVIAFRRGYRHFFHASPCSGSCPRKSVEGAEERSRRPEAGGDRDLVERCIPDEQLLGMR